MSDGRALLRARQFFGPRDALGRGLERAVDLLARLGVELPAPLAARPRRALDARRELHGLVLVEDPRQGRARHLGDPADRLPLQRPRRARLRAARLPARRLVLLVRLLAGPAQVPVRARRAAGAVPRGARARSATRSRPGRRSSPTPRRRAPYKSQRGKGGFVRASWDEVAELIAAAHVHTVKRYGPDRIAGFSPIPAMSMVSYSAGTRFLSLIGGVCLSFYDWYADLPPASPQIWGDQTDVPESADWWNVELPDAVGLEHPADAHARRALHDRGALPRAEGRRRLARLRRAHEVRRPLAARDGRAPTARSRWRWAT